jgi:drug/metabolite transporter (DMT)-like permease
VKGAGVATFGTYALLGIGGVACLAFSVVAARDAKRQPEYAWRQVGRSLTTVNVAIVVGFLLAGVFGSAVACLYYWFALRPRLRDAADQPPPPPSNTPSGREAPIPAADEETWAGFSPEPESF